MSAHLDLILGSLEKVKRTGKGYMACCPAHADRSPSLSVKEADNGKVLVHCFGGCKPKEVMAAIGLELRDLFADSLSMEERQRYEMERMEDRRVYLEVLLSIASNPDVDLSPDDWVTAIEAKQELDRMPKPDEVEWLDGEDMAKDAKAAVYLIDQMLESEAMGILGGASMTYKSFLALRMAYSIATGCAFFSHTVFTQGTVLYVCGEGKGGISRRWRALTIKYGSAPKGSFLVYNRALSFKSGTSMARLSETVEKLKPSLVIFDTFASLSGGIEENSTTEVALALANIRNACGKASVLIVHHYGKVAANGFRGASNFLNDTDFAWECAKPELIPVSTIKCLKVKDGEPFKPMDFVGVPVGLGLIDQSGREVFSLVAALDTSQYTIPDKDYSMRRG